MFKKFTLFKSKNFFKKKVYIVFGFNTIYGLKFEIESRGLRGGFTR